jgi:hypothetical protein
VDKLKETEIERDDLADKVQELEINLASLRERKTPIASRYRSEDPKTTLHHEDLRVAVTELRFIIRRDPHFHVNHLQQKGKRTKNPSILHERRKRLKSLDKN